MEYLRFIEGTFSLHVYCASDLVGFQVVETQFSASNYQLGLARRLPLMWSVIGQIQVCQVRKSVTNEAAKLLI